MKLEIDAADATSVAEMPLVNNGSFPFNITFLIIHNDPALLIFETVVTQQDSGITTFMS